MPFAYVGRAVSGATQGMLVDGQAFIRHGVDIVVDHQAVGGRVLPRQQRRARGRAQRAIDERIAEIDPLPGDALVEVGGLDEIVARDPEPVVPQVVDIEQQNVGAGTGLRNLGVARAAGDHHAHDGQ